MPFLIEQDPADWTAGYEDAQSGRPAEPGARDRFSYLSGWIAGASPRDNGDAASPAAQKHRSPTHAQRRQLD